MWSQAAAIGAKPLLKLVYAQWYRVCKGENIDKNSNNEKSTTASASSNDDRLLRLRPYVPYYINATANATPSSVVDELKHFKSQYEASKFPVTVNVPDTACDDGSTTGEQKRDDGLFEYDSPQQQNTTVV